MAWTAPMTAVAGTVMTAAQWNTFPVTAVNGAVHAISSSAQKGMTIIRRPENVAVPPTHARYFMEKMFVPGLIGL